MLTHYTHAFFMLHAMGSHLCDRPLQLLIEDWVGDAVLGILYVLSQLVSAITYEVGTISSPPVLK